MLNRRVFSTVALCRGADELFSHSSWRSFLLCHGHLEVGFPCLWWPMRAWIEGLWDATIVSLEREPDEQDKMELSNYVQVFPCLGCVKDDDMLRCPSQVFPSRNSSNAHWCVRCVIATDKSRK